MFVNSILEHEKNQIETDPQKLEDDVDRALRAVEMMWRDIDARHLLAFENGKAKLIWKSENRQDETTRMKKLTKLHLKLIKVRRTGDLMRYLANRLATWGKSYTEREAATILYESAILANRNLNEMHELALISAKQDIKFAVQLYERVETLSARRATTEQQQQQETGGTMVVRQAVKNRTDEGHENAQLFLEGISRLSQMGGVSASVNLGTEKTGDGIV
ncbi:hypothetical protein FGB62_18g08 [Gracilaria domingensis]|nr:hypothetical protein FGB62_18g08 [Gracilaria domingensis]